MSSNTEMLKEKIRNGCILERMEDMSDEYLEALKQTLVIVADTELMSAPALLSVYKEAPTLNNRITALAVVQDEIGHAHIALRLLKDLGVDTDELLYNRDAKRWKNPYAMDFRLDNWVEFGVFNAFFDRAGYTLLGDAYEHQSYAPWKRALVKVDKEELFHLRNGETIMKFAMEKSEETREQLKRGVEWMFLMALEFFGVADEKKSRSAQLEFKLKGRTNDELRQKWLSTAVPFCESIGVSIPAHYDEKQGKYVIDVPFPCKFDYENKKWLFDQPDTWENVIARWKSRGYHNEEFVTHLQRGRKELEALRKRRFNMSQVAASEQQYWKALKEVMDPEFPISVVDMGLIYDIKENQGTIDVTMTYTAASCACMQWIEEDIEKRLMQEPTVDQVKINVVWDPPWTVEKLSQEGREKLKYWGVSAK